MALPATAVFEVRTTGNDANGGAFDPAVAGAGTDLSQSDTPLFSYTDLVIGGTNTTLTSASKPFAGGVGGHVGNTVRITGGTGFTVGSYSIRSVAGAVATLDRAVGTAASTGGTGNLGGALASPGMAAGLVVSGNTVWIRSGTYALGNGTANTAGQKVAVAAASNWSGYATARGDAGTPPRLQGTAAAMVIFTASGKSRVTDLEAYRDPASGLTNVGGFALASSGSVGRRLRATNLNATGTNGGIVAGGTGVYIVDSLATGCACAGNFLAVSASGAGFLRCVDRGRTGGTSFATNIASGATFVDCLVDGNGVAAVGFAVATNADAVRFLHCVAYNTGAARGFDAYTHTHLEGCLVHTSGGFNCNGSGVGSVLWGCAAYNSLATGGPFEAIDGFLACTADPFADAAAGDFTLNDAPGGGALLKGIARTLPGLPGVGRRDVGAYQSAGGGGAAYYAM